MSDTIDNLIVLITSKLRYVALLGKQLGTDGKILSVYQTQTTNLLTLSKG